MMTDVIAAPLDARQKLHKALEQAIEVYAAETSTHRYMGACVVAAWAGDNLRRFADEFEAIVNAGQNPELFDGVDLTAGRDAA